MTAIKLEAFTGLIPRVSDRLIPNTAASVARNTKLLSGELRAFRTPREFAELTESFTVRRAHRIQYEEYGETEQVWLNFDSRDVDVVRSPLINDIYDRYYIAGDGRPMYNTRNRIIAGDPPLYLGVPTPTTAPTVTPPVGTSATRAYVYTFVSAYGEEGPPSPPTVATGNSVGTWALSNMDTSVPDSSNRNILTKNIYRTVPGQTATLFYFVGSVSLGTSTFNDTMTDADAALNNILESTEYTEPSEDMEGFVAMPNGYLVGWAGKRLLFSEPYRPHAWPVAYELSTEYEIVSLAVWDGTLVIGTKSKPYVGQGVAPSAFIPRKLDVVEPCLSRRGMVSTIAGVLYPSISGLVLVNLQGAVVITNDILTKEEWSTYAPASIFAAQLGNQYIAFNSPTFGFIFNPIEPASRFVELDAFEDIDGIETDPYTGLVYLLKNNIAYEWDPENEFTLFYRWRSKEFHFPKPINFGAYIASYDGAEIDLGDEVSELYGPYNEARFAAGPLSTLGGHKLGGGTQGGGQVSGWAEGEFRLPLGGSPLYPINFISTQEAAVRLIVYADGVEVYDRVIPHQRMNRLPAGFKATVWQFELIGNTSLYSLQVAQNGRELARV